MTLIHYLIEISLVRGMKLWIPVWMQHPVGYRLDNDGVFQLDSLSTLLTNPWAITEYAHTMVGATITGTLVMASIGSFYLIRRQSVGVA